jgi:membrane dipeptidase
MAMGGGASGGEASVPSMRLNWRDLGSDQADRADRATVEIAGFAAIAPAMARASHFILVAEPGCCPGCFPRDAAASVEVFAASPIPLRPAQWPRSTSWLFSTLNPASRARNA